MHIDQCKHTFEELASKVLPDHMEHLNQAIAAPRAAAQFADPDIGPRTLAKRFGHGKDFSGCYVLLDGKVPMYVGISRSVLLRPAPALAGEVAF